MSAILLRAWTVCCDVTVKSRYSIVFAILQTSSVLLARNTRAKCGFTASTYDITSFATGKSETSLWFMPDSTSISCKPVNMYTDRENSDDTIMSTFILYIYLLWWSVDDQNIIEINAVAINTFSNESINRIVLSVVKKIGLF